MKKRETTETERPRWMGRREHLIILVSWLVSSLVILAVTQTRFFLNRERAFRYREGDSVSENFVLERDLSFVDEEATEKAVALNQSLVPPVYMIRGDITEEILQSFDRFAALYPAALAGGGEAEEAFKTEFPGALGFLKGEFGRSIKRLNELFFVTRDVLQTLEYGGIFKLDEEDGTSVSGVIEVVYANTPPGQRVSLVRDAVVTEASLEEQVSFMTDEQGLPPQDGEFVRTLVMFFAEVNGYYSVELSRRGRLTAAQTTEPVILHFPAGTALLSGDTVVTSLQARALDALRKQRGLSYHNFLNPFLFMGLIFTLGLVLGRTFSLSLGRGKTFYLFMALSGVYLLIAVSMVELLQLPEGMMISVVIPTSLFTLLLAQLLQDRRLAMLTAVLMGILMLFLTGSEPGNFLITITAGIAGPLAVRRGETRMGLLKAGPRLAVVLATVTLLAGILTGSSLSSLLPAAGVGMIMGFLTGILSLAFLPLLEHVLNTATTFRLIELSDQNVPILRRMRLQAPGTYIHSQNVAHLAEAACDAINANGLLARIGAYYHDIGKIDQADYFVENQAGGNRHDDMKARLSAAVIKSHVKIGLEKGRELKLPDEVLAVIAQHHGTSVIRYFYERAVKKKGAEAAILDDFSYSGPKPYSKEAAVVMLADAAEAVGRTLKKPTAVKLEKYVWDLIMDRFRAGELNESQLTLRDLEIIKKSFVQVLTGHFHNRIEYPNISGEDGG